MLFSSLLLAAAAKTAPELIDDAFTAMGGRDRLVQIGSVKSLVVGHILHTEQSERPEGPYIVSYFEREESLDFDKKEWRGKSTLKGLIYGGTMTGSFAIAEGKPAPVEGRNLTMPAMVDDAMLRLNLGPERVLFVARAARDLRLGKSLSYQGVPHQEILFSWGKVPVKILLNAGTNLPTLVETTRTEPGFWSMWGDVKRATIWGTWDLRSNGTWFPLEWTQTMNGQTASEWSVINPVFAPGGGSTALKIDEPVPAKPMAIEAKSYRSAEVAKGISAWQGPYNTGVIEQSDGLVVLESVVNSSFAASFLDDLAVKYPGKRVKAVISTSDAWPHFGGIRTFVARGIPIYGGERNLPILNRYLAAPHTLVPDELHTKPAKVKFMPVSKAVSIGTGEEKLTIYPVAGEGSERMLMVYWPAKRVLYGSDLLQPMKDGFFTPGYVKELANAVAREGLSPETVFAMHMPPSPWKRVTDFLNKLGG